MPRLPLDQVVVGHRNNLPRVEGVVTDNTLQEGVHRMLQKAVLLEVEKTAGKTVEERRLVDSSLCSLIYKRERGKSEQAVEEGAIEMMMKEEVFRHSWKGKDLHGHGVSRSTNHYWFLERFR
jgi:hypothetical protein